MKFEHETTVDIIYKSIGVDTVSITVTVIVVIDGDTEKVKYAEAALPEHHFINKSLNYYELLLLTRCKYNRVAA